MFSHPRAMYFACVRQDYIAINQSRKHELVHRCCRRMDPAKLLGLDKLIDRQRIAEYDFDSADFATDAFLRVQLADFKLREFASEPF